MERGAVRGPARLWNPENRRGCFPAGFHWQQIFRQLSDETPKSEKNSNTTSYMQRAAYFADCLNWEALVDLVNLLDCVDWVDFAALLDFLGFAN